MEKIDIINQVKQRLSSDYKYATILVKGAKKPLYSFLEENFINHIKRNANPDVLVHYVNNKLKKIIELNNQDLIKVEEFIESLDSFEDIVSISETETRSNKNYLRDYAVKNSLGNGLYSYPGTDGLTIDEIYKKLLRDVYTPVTFEDKLELCESFIPAIEEEILNSTIEEMNVTVREYILNVLPNKMVDATNILVSGEKESIDVVVEQLCNYQIAKLKKEEQKLIEEQEIKYNKTTDNPGLVGLIQIALDDNQKIKVTTEMPEIKSSNLEDDELKSLIDNYAKYDLTDEEYYMKLLNNIKLAIDNSTNEHDLASKEKKFNKLKQEIETKKFSNQINVLIESIEETIIKKRNSIIKISNNQEDYIDLLFFGINKMKQDIGSYTTPDEFSKSTGELTALNLDIYNKGINDIKLESDIHILNNMLVGKRINFDSTIPDLSPEVERLKVDLDEQLRNIQSDLLNIEHDPNNLGNLAGTQIRLEHNMQVVKDAVRSARKDGILSSDDYEYYMNKIDNYTTANSITKMTDGPRW